MARLGFDLDGVVTKFFERLFEIYFQRHGVRYTVDMVTEHDLARVFGREVYEKMKAIFMEPGFYRSLEPYEGSVETINELHVAGHEIHFVTAPFKVYHPTGHKAISSACVAEKIDWVIDRFPHLGKNILVTPNKYVFKGDALVDDADYNITAWCKEHPEGFGFLVEQPWNAHAAVPANAIRKPFKDLWVALPIPERKSA